MNLRIDTAVDLLDPRDNAQSLAGRLSVECVSLAGLLVCALL